MPFSLLPKAIAGDITQVTPQYLHSQGIRLLMMDFDNTIVPYTTDTPTDAVLQWMDLIDKAYADIEQYKTTNIELYDTLSRRINTESIAIRYLIIQLHGSYYADDDLLRMKLAFKSDCTRLGVNRIKERVVIDTLWQQWGI